MGWFNGLFGQGSNDTDPFKQIDPKLRDFLERESSTKSKPTALPDTPKEPQRRQETETKEAKAVVPPSDKVSGQPEAAKSNGVPRESLFQDGRYAHLWKTYRPQAEVEAEGKTDHEKLMDVLEAFKDRKAEVGRTAMENCALEQMDWRICMTEGDWGSRVTMCSAEVRKFERCFNMQSRLLSALGYLSSPDRSQDEAIQMHADKLYHRMLEQEAAVEDAKAKGTPLPTFPPLMPRSTLSVTPDEEEELLKKVTPEVKKRWTERIAKVSAEDRTTEDAAIREELRAKAEIASRIQSIRQKSAEEREIRKREGRESIGDKITGLFGGSKPSS